MVSIISGNSDCHLQRSLWCSSAMLLITAIIYRRQSRPGYQKVVPARILGRRLHHNYMCPSVIPISRLYAGKVSHITVGFVEWGLRDCTGNIGRISERLC